THGESATSEKLPQRDRPAIAAEGVGYAYGQFVALRSVSFSLARGEFAYLVGPSAAGKTTLLKLIHGQLRPTSGWLAVNAVDVGRADRSELRRLRREVGVVPTASLDHVNANNVMDLLQRVALSGTTVLVATHDSNLVRESRCCVLRLDRGELKPDPYHDPVKPDQRLKVAWGLG